MQTRTTRRAVITSLFAAALPCAAGEPGGTLGRIERDPTFGEGGEVRSIDSQAARLSGVKFIALDGAGRIVVAGETSVGPAVARLLADGTMDETFGDGGVSVLMPHGAIDGLAVDPANRVVCIGRFGDSWGANVAVRVTEDGDLDSSFGNSGLVPNPSPGSYLLEAVALDRSDGSFVALECRRAAGGLDQRGLVRLLPDGEFDPAYGVGGFADLAFFTHQNAYLPPDVAVDGLGRAVVATSYIGVFRFTRSGLPDTDFGDLGVLRDALGNGVPGSNVEIDAADRIVVLSGEHTDENSARRTLQRFTPQGAPDTSFGDNGVVSWKLGFPANAVPSLTVLGVSAGPADRYAIVTNFEFLTPLGPEVGSLRTGSGHCVQSFDPARPTAVTTNVFIDPDFEATRELFRGVVVAPDGASAIAAGFSSNSFDLPAAPLLLRFDFTHETPLPMADVAARWLGRHAPGRGRLLVVNRGAVRAENVRMPVYLSLDDRFDDQDSYFFDLRIGALDPGKRTVAKIRWPFSRRDVAQHGHYVIVVADTLLPQPDEANDVAVVKIR